MAELDGQVAVVTGAGRGIGHAVALRLGGMGATVALAGRDKARLGAVRDQVLSSGGRAESHLCDLREPASIEALGNAVRERHGHCDILINNAGVAITGKPLHELAPEDWETMFATNLRAPYLMIRNLAPLMTAARSGHIINISSLAGKNVLPEGAAYSASKWGLNGLTYSVAEELRQYNVRVSVIAPGSVNTHFGGGGSTKDPTRMIQPGDVAQVVAMLVTQAPTSFVSEVLLRPTMKP